MIQGLVSWQTGVNIEFFASVFMTSNAGYTSRTLRWYSQCLDLNPEEVDNMKA